MKSNIFACFESLFLPFHAKFVVELHSDILSTKRIEHLAEAAQRQNGIGVFQKRRYPPIEILRHILRVSPHCKPDRNQTSSHSQIVNVYASMP